MSDLIKRIDDWLSCGTFDAEDLDAAEHLLIKCRAEIERLRKPYVPMTREEWEKLMDSYSDEHNTPWRKYIEAADIAEAREKELLAEKAALIAELRFARESVFDWSGYATEYFREKHGLQEDLDRIDAVLARYEAKP